MKCPFFKFLSRCYELQALQHHKSEYTCTWAFFPTFGTVLPISFFASSGRADPATDVNMATVIRTTAACLNRDIVVTWKLFRTMDLSLISNVHNKRKICC